MKKLKYLAAFTALGIAIILIIYNQRSSKDEAGSETRVKREGERKVSKIRERLPSEREISEVDVVGLDREGFFELFRGLDPGGRAYKERVLRVWGFIQHSEFSPLEGETGVKKGLVLPPAASSVFSGEEIAVKDIEALKSESEKEMGEKIFWLFSMDSLSGGKMIPQLINERSNKLPPTSLDLAVLYSSLKAFREINPISNKTKMASWSLMSQSSNPIYRLIALKASVVATPKEVQDISSEDGRFNLKAAQAKNRFYEEYLGETDPMIILELIKTISIHPCGEAKKNFEKLEGSPVVKSNQILKQEVEIARVNLDRFLE